ncbi:C40 family peptidase [Streptomyces griseorubiginosus]|uniref:C40 family peptidase n=1 Tax=Streptomyces TaxID=1883 RepID=UPI0004C2A86A|nr:C40 family peptidase [Streptomyces sp. NRRL B-3229]
MKTISTRRRTSGAILGASALALTAFFSAPAHAAQATADASCGVLAPGASATAQAAVDAACSQIGVWYSWGGGHAATPGASYGYYDGSDPDSLHDGERKGFDCSGLMRYAYYRATGKDLLNGTADDQFHTSQAAARFSAGQGTAPLLPGDLMFWGSGHIHHVAMYLGNGQMVEAYESGTHIRVTSVRTGGDYAGAVRINGSGTPIPPPANGGTVFETWGTGVRTHRSPSVGSDVVDTFPGPTQVSVQCQQHAETVTAEGYTNDAWAKLADGSWVTNIYIKGPAWLPGIPDCGGSSTPPPSGGSKAFQTWGTGVRTHSEPNVNAGVVDYFAQPTTVNVVCQAHAQTVTAEGYTNDAWAKLTDGSWMTVIYIKGPDWLPGVATC